MTFHLQQYSWNKWTDNLDILFRTTSHFDLLLLQYQYFGSRTRFFHHGFPKKGKSDPTKCLAVLYLARSRGNLNMKIIADSSPSPD